MSPSARHLRSSILRQANLYPRPCSQLSTSCPVRSYHSIHHPQPNPFPPEQDRILSSALAHVPQHGFSEKSLLLGAKENGYLEVSLQLFPRGPYDLVHYYLVTQRLALKDRVQFSEDAKLGVGRKVKSLAWERLLANSGIIQHWQSALGQMSLLENILASLKELHNLSDEIWYLAGDTTVDFNWYTKRASLSTVYASSELFMTTDNSNNFEATEEFLDRRLRDVQLLGSTIGGLRQYAGFWAGSSIGLARAWGMRI